MCRTLPAAVASLAINIPLYRAGPNTIGIIVYQTGAVRKSPMRVTPTGGSDPRTYGMPENPFRQALHAFC